MLGKREKKMDMSGPYLFNNWKSTGKQYSYKCKYKNVRLTNIIRYLKRDTRKKKIWRSCCLISSRSDSHERKFIILDNGTTQQDHHNRNSEAQPHFYWYAYKENKNDLLSPKPEVHFFVIQKAIKIPHLYEII